MIFYVIVMGIIGAIVFAMMIRKTGKNDAVSFSLKCPDCGYHKGILKCIQCEDRKRDDWR